MHKMSSNQQGQGNQMTKDDASRIQSTQVTLTIELTISISTNCSQAKSGGDMSSGGFAARAQGAGDKNANTGNVQGSNGQAKK
jgi:hypothetical protein